MKKYIWIISTIIALTAMESQAQSIPFQASVNRSELSDSLPSYEHLMLLCITDLYRNQVDDSRTGNSPVYYLFASDSSRIYYNLMKKTDEGYALYFPQKTKSKVFPFRKSARIAQYVSEKMGEGCKVSLGSVNKKKFIVQSF